MKAQLLLLLSVLLSPLSLGATEGESSGSQCVSIPGADMLAGSSVVVIGDLHGTNESPAIFRDLACRFAHFPGSGGRFIGLELPETFDGYFARPSVSLEAMLADEFWSGMGDGRHSAAMRSMVAQLMRMPPVRSGRVKLVALERRPIDAAGADKLEKLLAGSRGSRALVFIGNAHARKTRMRQQGVDPFASVLQKAGLDVLALDARAGGGSGWTCAPDCAVRPVASRRNGDEVKIVVDRCVSSDCAYDGYYYVPHLTVSKAWKAD